MDVPGWLATLCILSAPIGGAVGYQDKRDSAWGWVSLAYIAMEWFLPRPLSAPPDAEYVFWLGVLSTLGYATASVAQRNPVLTVSISGFLLSTVHALSLMASFRHSLRSFEQNDLATPELRAGLLALATLALALPTIRLAARLFPGKAIQADRCE